MKKASLLQAVRKRKDATQRKATEFLTEAMWLKKPKQQTHTDRTRCVQQRVINCYKFCSLHKTLEELVKQEAK